MAKHEVVSPVDHDGARYEEGAMIDLPEDAAAALLAVGVIKSIGSIAPDSKKPRTGEG